jgi:hypothetical protein
MYFASHLINCTPAAVLMVLYFAFTVHHSLPYKNVGEDGITILILVCVFLEFWWVSIVDVLGSIPGASRFSERQWVWNGVHSASWVLVSITEELLGRNCSDFGQENWEYDRGDPLRWPRNTSIHKSWYYFAKKRRSLGRRGSLADQSHGVFFF